MEERAAKPKMTKAERRALQERQRAAKASAKMGGEQGAGAASLPGVKPGQANAPTPPSTGQVASFIYCTGLIYVLCRFLGYIFDGTHCSLHCRMHGGRCIVYAIGRYLLPA